MKTIFSVFTLIILLTTFSIADIIHVPAEINSIQEAIDLSSDGDTVLIDVGTYTENISLRGKNIVLGSLALTTGDTSYISQTIIHGNNNGTVVTFNSDEDSRTVLRGFTIQNGLADVGGGIYCENVSPTLMDLVIRENSAVTDGGGLAIFGSNITLDNVFIMKNNAEVGAGIYCVGSDLVLKKVIVDNNSALREGGGFQIHDSNLQLDSCTISNNQAQEGGGGFQYIADESDGEIYEIIISSTKFEDNFAAHEGGGMAVINPEQVLTTVNVYLDQCRFKANTADAYGGLRLSGVSVEGEITRSSFTGNEAAVYCAGLGFDKQSKGRVSNCLFANNGTSANGNLWHSGGAGVMDESDAEFFNCSFVENSALYGAGLTVMNGGLATTTNCIFWGNSPDQLALFNADMNVSYCDVQGGQDGIIVFYGMSDLNWGEGNIDKYPMFVDGDNEDFHLTDYSLCIGSGTPTGAPVIDFEGNPRPNPPGSNPDIGAYENDLASALQEAHIIVSDDTLDFARVFLGVTDSLELEVRNGGTLDLLITSVFADLPVYSVEPEFAGIYPNDSRSFLITFSPQTPGAYAGSLTIISNDPDSDTLLVYLEGQGIEPPEILVSPDSLSDQLYTDQNSRHTLIIENEGASNLNFDIHIANLNSALIFDGSDGYIDVPELAFNNLPSGTVEFWINADMYERDILYKETYNAETISGIRINYDGKIEASHYNFWGSDDVVSSTSLTLNQWYHVGWTWDGKNQKIYINGDLDNSQQSMDGVADDPGVWVRWGRGDSFFRGILDELRIWGEARTQNEIQMDMNREISGFENGLMGYWNLNEGAGITAADRSKNNYHGTLNGTVRWIQASTPVNNWLSVDPVAGSISSGSASEITATFNASGLMGGDYFSNIIILNNDPDESKVIIPAHLNVTGIPDISLSDTTLDFGEAYVGFPKTDSLIVANKGTELLTISNISSDNSLFTLDTAGFDLNIGESRYIFITLKPDIIGLHTGVLTINSNDSHEPVRTISLMGQGVIAPKISVTPDSLQMELSAGDTTSRKITISNTGGSDLNFDVKFKYGEDLQNQNYALQFNGLDGVVRMLEDDIFDLSTALTIEAWINAFSTYDPRVIVSKWNDFGPDFSYIFKIWNTSDKLSIELSEYNYYGDLATLYSNTSIPVNEWVHVAVTYNSDNVTLYYNGDIDNSVTASGTIRNSMSDLIIGSNQYGTNTIENFYGLIDEVRVWNLARAQEDIQSDMNLELSGNESGLIGYWPFNEGTGSTAFDKTSNDNNGSLEGGVQWVPSTAPLSTKWCIAEPQSGLIPAGTHLDIKLMFDATGLNEGDYTATAHISCNDPEDLVLTVPINLKITPTGIEDENANETPKIHALFQNYPNPFNPSTRIKFALPKPNEVQIELYNILGQRVKTLLNRHMKAGHHELEFTAENLSSGVYYYRIKAGEFQDVKKMILLR